MRYWKLGNPRTPKTTEKCSLMEKPADKSQFSLHQLKQRGPAVAGGWDIQEERNFASHQLLALLACKNLISCCLHFPSIAHADHCICNSVSLYCREYLYLYVHTVEISSIISIWIREIPTVRTAMLWEIAYSTISRTYDRVMPVVLKGGCYIVV